MILIIEDTHLIDGYSVLLINQIKKSQNKFIICTYQNNINPYKTQKPSLLEADKEIKLSGSTLLSNANMEQPESTGQKHK